MNGRPLTDGQISEALRAHLPERAQAGLRERILEATEATVQRRALPSFLGALTDADPVARQRSLLLAAAALIALAFASAAAVGAWRQLQRDALPELHLQRPADIPAFVLASRGRMTQLPPIAFTTLESDGTMDRIYVDGSGAMRVERYASADATEPSRTTILSGTSVGQTVHVGPDKVWVVNDGTIGDDPRTYIPAFTGLYSSEGSGCETSQDQSKAGTATAATPATGWRYVGAEYVAGRPAHHLSCAGVDLWIDDATGLFLRVRQPATDDAGNPIPGAFKTTEITKIDFAEQSAGLFALLTPPTGVPVMSNEEYGNLCPGDTVAFGDRPCSGTPPAAVVATPEPTPTPTPTPTPRPKPSDCATPAPNPGKPAGPLAWTQASLKQDWPAPVRPEPAGAPSVQPMPPTYIDPSGDAGSPSLPCVDIRDVTAGPKSVSFDLMSKPPGVDPSRAWIAYGVVVDEDRDGVPDWRYGIDNLPGTAVEKEDHHRAWRTNLHTGRTDFNPDAWPGREMDQVGDASFGSRYPAFATSAGFRFYYTADTTTGGEIKEGAKLDKPFYVWASVIVDGRVVATDYAPDSGWLIPSPGATPGGTFVVHGVDGVPLRISMNLPAGWSGGGPGVSKSTRDEYTGLQFTIIDKGLGIGCDQPNGTISEMRVGPSVDDLVTFLEGLQRKRISDKTNVALKISETTDVTVEGYRGKYLEFTATGREDNCVPPDGPSAPGWPGADNHEVWILDVDGVRLVIDASAPTSSETVKAEIQQIVDSIHIGP